MPERELVSRDGVNEDRVPPVHAIAEVLPTVISQGLAINRLQGLQFPNGRTKVWLLGNLKQSGRADRATETTSHIPTEPRIPIILPLANTLPFQR